MLFPKSATFGLPGSIPTCIPAHSTKWTELRNSSTIPFIPGAVVSIIIFDISGGINSIVFKESCLFIGVIKDIIDVELLRRDNQKCRP